MAIHSKTENMLKESLNELLTASELCIKFKKDDGGCLGYPAATILLQIADTIGSYYRSNKEFKIRIDGAEKTINTNGYQHFYIFNSTYYNLGLSEKMIKKVYANYRSFLVHNAVIPKEHFIDLNNPFRAPFLEGYLQNSRTGEHLLSLSLIPLHQKTEYAISQFIKNIDSVFPSSKQADIIKLRK